ncbi:hypothetical protein ACHAXA_000456 [Cyclostephanos tholiformis]|uniref:Uncharacterized protein n=1 Tax=Cyclostephanos tholiformis TaxID=382380 RepID=A0ABD3RVY9_9STRA
MPMRGVLLAIVLASAAIASRGEHHIESVARHEGMMMEVDDVQVIIATSTSSTSSSRLSRRRRRPRLGHENDHDEEEGGGGDDDVDLDVDDVDVDEIAEGRQLNPASSTTATGVDVDPGVDLASSSLSMIDINATATAKPSSSSSSESRGHGSKSYKKGQDIGSTAAYVKSPTFPPSHYSPRPSSSNEYAHASNGGKSGKGSKSKKTPPMRTKSPATAIGGATTSSPLQATTTTTTTTTTNHPTYSSSPPDVLPPLVWMGASGCSPSSPCPICHGDCDTDLDCAYGLICFYRIAQTSTSTSTNTTTSGTPIPGCGIGGPGDVDGADYCHDPNHDGSGGDGSAIVVDVSWAPSPTNDDIVTTTTTTTTDRPDVQSSTTTTTTTTSSSLPYLTWGGVNGCTPASPCMPCHGDCDDDADCITGGWYEAACYKRADGSTDQVPGCEVGGTGDVPGADYCYAVANTTTTAATTTTTAATTTTATSSVPVPTPMPVPQPQGTTTLSPTVDVMLVPPTTIGTSIPPTGVGSGTDEVVVAHFIRSRATTTTITTAMTRSADDGAEGWCIGGALSPDYYQLLMEECTPDYDGGSNGFFSHDAYVTTRMEQMDQLWVMDGMGYIRSSFDHGRCMIVPSSYVDGASSIAEEAPVEIGPCSGAADSSSSGRFYYGTEGRLRLIGHMNYCVTFMGGNSPTKGSSVILGQCPGGVLVGEGDKHGWDLVPERDLIVLPPKTLSPVASPVQEPALQYLGRNACSPETPCQECSGDCDNDDDCSIGLMCFEREMGDVAQVPGCGTGGPGDIPGADFCYNPSPANDDGDDGSVPAPPAPAMLRWLGSKGCTPTRPCGACSGDCDEDGDCLDGHECFKRLVGDSSLVPGCGVGGPGDIPGGDYCYDVRATTEDTDTTMAAPSTSRSFSSGSGEVDVEDDLVYYWSSFRRMPPSKNLALPLSSLSSLKEGDRDVASVGYVVRLAQ